MAQKLDPNLWNNSIPVPFSGCFIWMRCTDQKGYGLLWLNGGMRRAHRIAWQLANGEIPDGMLVLHHCDTPSCINPLYLFLGTHHDNEIDSVRKLRHKNSKKRCCPSGHTYDEQNTYWNQGGRYCRSCKRASDTRRRNRLREKGVSDGSKPR